MNILQFIAVFVTLVRLSEESSEEFGVHCGIKEIGIIGPRIANGIEVGKNEWPWLASLIYMRENSELKGQFFCAATLVSLKSALTAAHCIQAKTSEERLNIDDFEVHLGRHDLRDNNELQESAKVLLPIVVIAMHPEWSPMDNSDNRYDADLALLVAGKNIDYSPFISPVCLPARTTLQDSCLDNNVLGTIVGWGFSSDDQTAVEDKPRKAQVVRVSPEDCFLEDHALVVISSKRTFCVKGVEEGAGPCTGDSGGAFLVKRGDFWTIDGIVSSGVIEKKCPSTVHSVFTKVSAFIDWIEEGSSNFHAVKFTYELLSELETESDVFNEHHELKIPEVVHQGAFLSTIDHSIDSSVINLWAVNQIMIYFPNNIGSLFPRLKELYANSSQVEFIDRVKFKNMERLENLVLKNNMIEEIPPNTFYDLERVQTIDISSNKLKVVHAGTFANNPVLKSIDASFNQISSIEQQSFNNKNVEELLLSNNLLESIAHDTFYGMKNLEVIGIANNAIGHLHDDIFLNNLELKKIFANDNQIESLSQGLFRVNEGLYYADFANNKIKEIECTFSHRGNYNFNNNVCVDRSYDFWLIGPDELNAELKELCSR